MTAMLDRTNRLRRDWAAAREALIRWAFEGDMDAPYAEETGRNLTHRVVRTHEVLADARSFAAAARRMAGARKAAP